MHHAKLYQPEGYNILVQRAGNECNPDLLICYREANLAEVEELHVQSAFGDRRYAFLFCCKDVPLEEAMSVIGTVVGRHFIKTALMDSRAFKRAGGYVS